MYFNDTFVKLLPNSSVKILLEGAKRDNFIIEVIDSGFLVRESVANQVTFRGIKIKENVWGITFSKQRWAEESKLRDALPTLITN